MGCNTTSYSVLVFFNPSGFSRSKDQHSQSCSLHQAIHGGQSGGNPQCLYRVDLRRAECKGLYYWAETVLPRLVFIVEKYTIQHQIPQNITIRAIMYLHIIVLRMPSHALPE